MITHWDNLANIFADHDARTEREAKARYQEEVQNNQRVEQTASAVLRDIPNLVRTHLERRTVQRLPIGEWVTIYSCNSSFKIGRAIIDRISVALGKEGIATKETAGGDETSTSWELEANIEDLRNKAKQHINRPKWKAGSP